MRLIKIELLKLRSRNSIQLLIIGLVIIIFNFLSMTVDLLSQIKFPVPTVSFSALYITTTFLNGFSKSIYVGILVVLGAHLGYELQNQIFTRNRIDGLSIGEYLICKGIRIFYLYVFYLLLLVIILGIITGVFEIRLEPVYLFFSFIQLFFVFLYTGSFVLLISILLRRTGYILLFGYIILLLEAGIKKILARPDLFLPATFHSSLYDANGIYVLFADGNIFVLIAYFFLIPLYLSISYRLLKKVQSSIH